MLNPLVDLTSSWLFGTWLDPWDLDERNVELTVIVWSLRHVWQTLHESSGSQTWAWVVITWGFSKHRLLGPRWSFWFKRCGVVTPPWEPLYYTCPKLGWQSDRAAALIQKLLLLSFCIAKSNFLEVGLAWWWSILSSDWLALSQEFLSVAALAGKHCMFSKWWSYTGSSSKKHQAGFSPRRISPGL